LPVVREVFDKMTIRTAEDIIRTIASDYYELSYDKVMLQRDYYFKMCRDWVKQENAKNYIPSKEHELDDNF
jgi:hypothetical protein